MKKLLVFLLIFSLATISLAGPLADAEKLARKDVNSFVVFLAGFFMGVIIPISPLIIPMVPFEPSEEELEAVASYYGKDSAVTWHYVQAYKRIYKSAALIGSLAGSLLDILLIYQLISLFN